MAAVAMAAAVVLAAATPPGPWQPLSVLAGWLGVVLLAGGLVIGLPAACATAVVLMLGRLAVQGLAGDPTPGPAVSAGLIVAMIEATAMSVEASDTPYRLVWGLLRVLSLAVGAAATVTMVQVTGLTDPGAAGPVLGLAAALVLALVVTVAGRDAGRFSRGRRG